MSKTNTEKMAPETQTPEMANGMKLDVRVRPIAPMGNLLAFANVTIGGCFKIDGFHELHQPDGHQSGLFR